MKRLPVVSTLVVGIAMAVMVALGVWQLQRAEEKNVLLAKYAAMASLPEMAFPAVPYGDELLFRRAGGLCLQPSGHRIEGGVNASGKPGWRHIFSCRTGAKGPGMTVDIGWSSAFDLVPLWTGGRVRGVISREPDHRSLFARALGRGQAPGLMLVLATPADGLEASAPPSLKDVPNNHLAYAVQWFIFAAVAAIIYLLALRRRSQPA